MHLVRHPEEQVVTCQPKTDNRINYLLSLPHYQVGYVRVRNSETLQQFGEQQMAQPGPRAHLESRQFIHMKPEEVLSRKEKVGQTKTLAGIKSKFEYICLPDKQVMWQHYTCCCPASMDQRWWECAVPQLVGELETVVPAGGFIYSG